MAEQKISDMAREIAERYKRHLMQPFIDALTADIQAALDEEWNEAVEASAKKIGSFTSDSIADYRAIRDLRREGTS